MLPPNDELVTFIEELIEAGAQDMSAIEDAFFARYASLVDPEAAVRTFCKKRVSLLVSTCKDEAGERVMFTVKDADGTRVIAHMVHTNDPTLWIAVADRYEGVRREAVKLRDRAHNRAQQLTLALPGVAA